MYIKNYIEVLKFFFFPFYNQSVNKGFGVQYLKDGLIYLFITEFLQVLHSLSLHQQIRQRGVDFRAG